MERLELVLKCAIRVRSDEPWPVRVFKRAWVRCVRGLKVEMQGPGHTLTIGRGGKLSGKVLIYGTGNHVFIGNGCFIEATWIDVNASDSEVRIGDDVRLFGSRELGCSLVLLRGSGRSITIGNTALLSYGIELRNCDGHSIHDQETGKLLNAPRDILVGEHVWIGAHAMLLKGASVASGSIVAAGSIVTGPIGAGLIAAGRPAVEKRRGIYWTLHEPVN